MEEDDDGHGVGDMEGDAEVDVDGVVVFEHTPSTQNISAFLLFASFFLTSDRHTLFIAIAHQLTFA